jgi:hypothetical protein
MAAKNLSRPSLKQRILWIKESMRKQLTLHNVDLAPSGSEKNVSNHMHMMDVLSDLTMKDLPDEILK